MDVKQAAKIATNYVYDMESLLDTTTTDEEQRLQFLKDRRFSIEGTHFDDSKKSWIIEIGFTRPWDRAKSSAIANLSGTPNSTGDNRSYKTIVVSDDSGHIISYGE